MSEVAVTVVMTWYSLVPAMQNLHEFVVSAPTPVYTVTLWGNIYLQRRPVGVAF